MRTALFLLSLLLAAPVSAQQVSSLNPPVTSEDLATLQAKIPLPADAPPPAEMVGGAPGSTMTFRRGDAAQPRITRAAVASTASDGTWSVTWTSPLAQTPAVLPIAANPTATQAIVCNTTTRTMTGATGRCWQAMAPALINITIATNPLPAVGAGVTVQVFAIPLTQ